MQLKEFHLPNNILKEVYDHAEQEYPSECCGWILKELNGNYNYIASQNLQDKYHKFDPNAYPRTSKDAFLMNTLKLSKDIEQTQKRGGSLYCIVHSHIHVGAYFSKEDKKQMAEPDRSKTIYPSEFYLVVNVNEAGKVDQNAVFYFDQIAKDFLEANLMILS